MTIQSIAIIGSGISGISAAYMLSRRYRVTLFEASHRLGGHSNTVTTAANHPVDTGFIVFNSHNYPYFCQFLDQLGVPSHESDMSFAYYNRSTNYVYSSDVPWGLFSHKPNIVSPRFYHFIYSILRFNKVATQALDTLSPTETINDFLIRHLFNESFCNEYVFPMGAAIWSTSHQTIRQFPARAFISFWHHHRLLQIRNRPMWRTVKGGSIQYIRAVLRQSDFQYYLNTPIQRVVRHHTHVTLKGPGLSQSFDAVVIATHADQAYRMIESPTSQETEALSPWSYSSNHTVLHTSASVAPRQRAAWASWIYTRHNDTKMSASYYMNRLQNISSPMDYFVTLNSPDSLPDDTVEYATHYEHPVMNQSTIATQPHLRRLNGPGRTYYCGSYFGNGFHEDGIAASVAVANALGCAL